MFRGAELSIFLQAELPHPPPHSKTSESRIPGARSVKQRRVGRYLRLFVLWLFAWIFFTLFFRLTPPGPRLDLQASASSPLFSSCTCRMAVRLAARSAISSQVVGNRIGRCGIAGVCAPS